MDGAEKKDWGKKLGRKEKKGGFIFIWKGPKKGKFMKLLNVVRNDPTGDYIYMICSIICISGWCFRAFFIFIPTWGNDPI